ncbi:hypothetical protein [Acinetobacter baumannii]|uniref:hypothetical protein n=1 Tax=Acinetobacter baumannii TaxID=470 RepID=UPI001D17E990|nr:hypothetical protein [Acinetobacter baumannii]
MKRSLTLLLSTFISIQAFAEENACEKFGIVSKIKMKVSKLIKLMSPVNKFGKIAIKQSL